MNAKIAADCSAALNKLTTTDPTAAAAIRTYLTALRFELARARNAKEITR